MKEVYNIWKENTDENVVRSWLLGVTDGQTYSITEHFAAKVTIPNFDYEKVEVEWDGIIDYKHDWKLDDEGLEDEVKRICGELNRSVAEINSNPEKYSY